MNHNIQSTYVESLKLRCKHWHDLYLDKLGALFAGGPSVTKDKRLVYPYFEMKSLLKAEIY